MNKKLNYLFVAIAIVLLLILALQNARRNRTVNLFDGVAEYKEIEFVEEEYETEYDSERHEVIWKVKSNAMTAPGEPFIWGAMTPDRKIYIMREEEKILK